MYNIAVCFQLCETEKDEPEIIMEPNLGQCPGYESLDEDVRKWLRQYKRPLKKIQPPKDDFLAEFDDDGIDYD